MVPRFSGGLAALAAAVTILGTAGCSTSDSPFRDTGGVLAAVRYTDLGVQASSLAKAQFIRFEVDAKEEVDQIVSQAETKAMEAEAAAQEARRKKREEDRLAAIEAEYAAADAATGGAGRVPTAPTAGEGEATEVNGSVAEASAAGENTQDAAAEEGGPAS